MPELSLVVPVFNEQESVAELAARVEAALRPLRIDHELLFVDDGSLDQTASIVRQLQQSDPRIRLLSFSRNFGHQAALYAGLEHARGRAVISMDGDLQHPPDLLPEFVRLWREGCEVVQGVRRRTADSGVVKSATSRWFYRLLSRLAHIQLQPGAADFRLMDRAAVTAFLACRERVRFNRGLIHWIGFRACEVPYEAPRRFAGRTKYTWRKMTRLAADAIFSFSSWPLRLAGLAGVIVSGGALIYLLFALWAYFFTDRAIAGWTSILATVLVLGGVQLMVLWILGEYVGRMYEEVKQRPLYVIRDAATPMHDQAGATTALAGSQRSGK